MAWEIEFDSAADRDLSKIDSHHKRRILLYLRNKIATDGDPCRFGDPLSRNLKGLWKYRIGNYRVICEIQEKKLLFLFCGLVIGAKFMGDIKDFLFYGVCLDKVVVINRTS